jgi:bifunctional non-homologous end joining protein LigD
VAVDEQGVPDFPLLQEAISESRSGSRGSGGKDGRGGRGGHPGRLLYQAFDLLYLDGRSLLRVPLEDRKRLLRSVLRESPRVRYASHVDGDGRAFYQAASQRGLEGVVAKLRRSTYEPGRRTPAWLKIKIRPEQELVVGGWTAAANNAKDLGALAVGVYEDGALRFSGKVGSGFTAATRRALLKRLEPLTEDDPPFDPPPPRDYRGRWGGDLVGVTWVRPDLVIRAELGGWSRDGIVRQSAFKGVEEGRDPTTVARERAVACAEQPGRADDGVLVSLVMAISTKRNRGHLVH